VFTQYLIDESGLKSVSFRYAGKPPPGYGTREYFERLDLNARAEDSGGLAGSPRTQFFCMTLYPAGYYSALAAWIKLVRVFSHRITVLFFGARLFSVLLLACSLVLMYATARELRFTCLRALLMTGIAGLFPMTTFVASYIQPDNLSLLLVMLCCYLALRLRRDPENVPLLWLLGIALGLLCVTKYHFYVATSLAILPMVIADQLAERRKQIGWQGLAAAMLAPTLLLFSVQVWISYGVGAYPLLSDPNTQHQDLSRVVPDGVWAVISFLADGIALAFSNFYLNGSSPLNGSTFSSFWGNFGWLDTPLTIMTPQKTEVIRDVIALLDVAVFGLVLVRLEQVVGRLISIARRGRWKWALRIASSNPLMNAYFLFTVLMFGLFMVVRLSFSPQGRNWFPFILAIFMVGSDYASKALSQRRSRRVFRLVIVGGLILYCIVGSYYAIQSINQRYYSSAETAAVSLASPRIGLDYADMQETAQYTTVSSSVAASAGGQISVAKH
jgi:4-amino-4-deoxy-L-arabinose transferase-like glycosyltransferase